MANQEELKRMEKMALAVEGDDQIRGKKCTQEINQTLAKYDCIMVPQLMVSPGHVEGTVMIIPKPRRKPS